MANYSKTRLRKMVLTAIQELQIEGTICYKSGQGFIVCDKNNIG